MCDFNAVCDNFGTYNGDIFLILLFTSCENKCKLNSPKIYLHVDEITYESGLICIGI